MYLHRKHANALLKESHAAISEKLHEHLSFVTELLDGDDWSFVIKAQALLEACVTEAIVVRLGDDRVQRTVESMPLVGDEVSKLQLAKELNLIDAPQRRFIKKLAALRNRLAHRVEYVNFTFEQYTSALDRDMRKDWQESIVWFGEDPAAKAEWREAAIKQPRYAVLIGVFLVAALLAIDGNQAKLMRAIDAASEKSTAELLGILRDMDGAQNQ